MAKKKNWYSGGDQSTKVKASNPSKMPGCHPNKKITLHNEGVSRQCDGGQHVINLAKYVRDKGIYYHGCYCPDCGQWAWIIPIDCAARSQVGGSVNSCGNSANRCGVINVQICFAGYGPDKKLPNPKNWKNAKKFKKIAEGWGVPAKARNMNKVNRSRDKWNDPSIGWHTHACGPNDDHTDCVGNEFDWKKFKKHVLKVD